MLSFLLFCLPALFGISPDLLNAVLTVYVFTLIDHSLVVKFGSFRQKTRTHIFFGFRFFG